VFLTRTVFRSGIICAHIFIVVIQFVRRVEIRLHMQKHYYNMRAGVIVCDVQGTCIA